MDTMDREIHEHHKRYPLIDRAVKIGILEAQIRKTEEQLPKGGRVITVMMDDGIALGDDLC